MGIFDGVLLCSDIDGTLTSDGKVSAENKKSIEFFKSEGGLFTVSTGRYPGHFKEMYNIDVNTLVISVNGTVISDVCGNNIIYNQKLNLGLIKCIYDFVFPRYSLENFWAADINRLDLPYGMRADYESNKLMFVPYEEKEAQRLASELQAEFSGDVYISRSWATGVEVIPKDSGKGVCVQKLKDITGSKLLVCVGDYENDLTMLKSADVGFAVANAIDSVKAVADRQTVSDSQTAIAEIIETIRNEYI